MIAKLTGLIDSTGEAAGENWAVIDVGGVGYLVFCSGRGLARLAVGEAASLMIETQVRQDHIHLFGFVERLEREWFRLLTTVQGVGAKVALAILSVIEPDALMVAIAAADKAAITQAAGVGPKLATRIISELRDKVGSMVAAAPMGGPGGGPAAAVPSDASDAASALVNLGYEPLEALSAVSHVAGRLGVEAGVEALIRGGLAELAPQEVKG